MAPALISFPLELLILVSSHLSTPDLGSLRRTCKHIERSLYETFAKEFFTKKQFMLTQPSLQALVDISNHHSLSKQLEHVIIGLEEYNQFSLTGAQDPKYKLGCEEQSVLIKSVRWVHHSPNTC